jgi:SAM-dependent methyltransferase
VSSRADAQLAADYDLIFPDWDGMTERVVEIMNGHLPVASGALLDAACGTGMACDAAQRLGWVVTGADSSTAMLARARARLPGVEFRVAELTRLHSDIPRTFNAVITVGNGLHLVPPAQLPLALTQMRACTRPGGVLMLVVRDLAEQRASIWRDDPTARVTSRFTKQANGQVAWTLQIEDADGVRTHEQLLYPLGSLELASAVEKAGFRVTRAGKVSGRLAIAATAV